MSDRSKIEWTEATWNPVRGCSRVSEGCRHCYAERHAARFSGTGLPFEGFAVIGTDGPHWTGRVELVPDKLAVPLRWRRPRRVFVNSMSDLFHEGLSNEAIAAVFGVMAASPRHAFQVLTKRPERMRAWFRWIETKWAQLFPLDHPQASEAPDANVALQFVPPPIDVSADEDAQPWPLPNVWLGVSVEDQATADARIPLLLETPAAVRFVSAEPLLGQLRLGPWIDRCPNSKHVNGWQHGWHFDGDAPRTICAWCGETRDAQTAQVYGHRSTVCGLDWVIVGGESGHGARPMHPDWARGLRDQCDAAGVAFFFKQWGAWAQLADPIDDGCMHPTMKLDGVTMCQYGKHAAGRELDGREHNDLPAHAQVLA